MAYFEQNKKIPVLEIVRNFSFLSTVLELYLGNRSE
jgi:hypothetical protein